MDLTGAINLLTLKMKHRQLLAALANGKHLATDALSLGMRRNFAQSTASSPIAKKVCIVGAGPAGFYAAQYLVKHLPDAEVDIVEKLPVPFGLVR